MARDRRDEDDDRRRARRRERDDDHERERDRDRRHHRGDKKEKKAKKEHKRERSHRRHGSDEEEAAAKRLPAGARPISEADYFLRATEFRVWLARSKSKYVEELSTDESTALFRDKFARKWNRGKLPREYYVGLPESMVEQTRRTRHQWGFVAKLGDRERFDLATAKDSVGVATRKTDLLASSSSAAAAPAVNPPKDSVRERSPARRSDRRDEDDERDEQRRSWKRQRRDRASDMEELVPKETGHQALVEKRRQVAQKLHGAARDREENRDGLDVSDDFLMGGKGDGSSGLERRLAQRDSARRQRDAERQERLAGLQAKESARMDKFLQDMGLAGGGKARMTIAPRPPPSS